MSEVGQKYAFSAPLNRVWNAVVTRHSVPNSAIRLLGHDPKFGERSLLPAASLANEPRSQELKGQRCLGLGCTVFVFFA